MALSILHRAASGCHRAFTLLELMIVVAVIAIVAAIAIPGLLRARMVANETSAIGTLRTIATAQTQFHGAGLVDQDSDGTGEFGWLQELSGVTGYRDATGGIGATSSGPAFVTTALGASASDGDGIASKAGYHLRVFLPREGDDAEEEHFPPDTFDLPEDAGPQETRFICYAWPIMLGSTGMRAFVVNQQGEVFSTRNRDAQNYSGTMRRRKPEKGDALVAVGSQDPDNLEGVLDSASPAEDGYIWLPVGN